MRYGSDFEVPFFFNFLSDCIFIFSWFGTSFGKTPYLALSVGFILEKNVAIVTFHFRTIMVDETDAKMADVINGGRRGRMLLVTGVATAILRGNNIIFLSSNCKLSTNDISKCNECVKEERIGTDHVYYLWKSVL